MRIQLFPYVSRNKMDLGRFFPLPPFIADSSPWNAPHALNTPLVQPFVQSASLQRLFLYVEPRWNTSGTENGKWSGEKERGTRNGRRSKGGKGKRRLFRAQDRTKAFPIQEGTLARVQCFSARVRMCAKVPSSRQIR